MNQKSLSLSSVRVPAPALTVLSLLCGIAMIGHAQTLPGAPAYRIGDAVKEAQPKAPAAVRPASAPQIVDTPAAPLSLAAGDTLPVQSFRLIGADYLPEAELQASLAPYRQRQLTMAEIDQAAGALTALYRRHGYPVARAYVPRQDARDGVLAIQVVVGQLGQLSLRNSSLVGDNLLQQVFAPLQGQPLSRADLERALGIIRYMPGAQTPRLTVAPGQTPGSSDLTAEVGAGPRWGGTISGDNLDTPAIGKYRTAADLYLNSLLGVADRLGLNTIASRDSGLLSGRLSYSFPLAANGLRLELVAMKTRYELGGDYAGLDATGTSTSGGAELSYPLLLSQERYLNLHLNLQSRQMRDDIGALQLSTPKRAQVAALGLVHEVWGSLAGYTSYSMLSAEAAYGRLAYKDPAQAAQDRQLTRVAGDYGRLSLGARSTLDLTPAWTLDAEAHAQHALTSGSLDGSEQMSISGRSGVMAYQESFSGDNAWTLRAELRRTLPAPGSDWRQSLGLFTDTGRAWLQDAHLLSANGVRLSDLGWGYYASYRALSARLQLARTVGARPASYRAQTRAMFQLALDF